MPVGSAVHARTLALCESLSFRDWSGYYAVSAFEAHHDHEYNAIRNAAALIDVSPLFKYLITGPDAAALVDRVITRPASAMAVGQVYYTPWCDERGKVIDDGTVTRVAEHTFRWTAADPSLRWISDNAAGLRVEMEDISEKVAGASRADVGRRARARARGQCIDRGRAEIFPDDTRLHRGSPCGDFANRVHR